MKERVRIDIKGSKATLTKSTLVEAARRCVSRWELLIPMQEFVDYLQSLLVCTVHGENVRMSLLEGEVLNTIVYPIDEIKNQEKLISAVFSIIENSKYVNRENQEDLL